MSAEKASRESLPKSAIDEVIQRNRRGGVRRTRSSRPAFQIWPHAAQRQYVDALTFLLVVLMSTELQKGQVVGAAVSDGWMSIHLDSQRRGPYPWPIRCSAIQ